MENRILVENFWNVGDKYGDKTLRENELGWPLVLQQDAQSDYSETIFRYVIEQIGFNLVFYWLKDRNFYVIETEKEPIEVRRLYPNPNWDGKCEFFKVGLLGEGASSCSAGEVLATFDDVTRIWNELKIYEIPIGEVIAHSCVVTWD
ncbi:MAG: hypothetical protein IJS89_01950 [Bacteroidaceae bacterium]|nr:hypothetical protein [Bacteroidaceae bacterium]